MAAKSAAPGITFDDDDKSPADLLRLVDHPIGVPQPGAGVGAAPPLLRRICRAPARRVRLEQGGALRRLLDPADRERFARTGAGLAPRPLRPTAEHASGHGAFR